MPRYRIHRMKEVPRESFRWAAHTGGLAVVKPKDYESSEEIEADTPYQAWKLMAEQGRALHPGDLLEIRDDGTEPRKPPPAMWIAKYIGFEPAQWWSPVIAPELDLDAENGRFVQLQPRGPPLIGGTTWHWVWQ